MQSITLKNGKVFEASETDSLLTAARKSNINLPYSCNIGRCCTCKCKVISGETVADLPETGLTQQEKQDGWVLSCVRKAVTDVVLDVEDLGDKLLPKAKTFPCRINSIELLASDVIRVFLRLPPSADFSFIAGQYIDVIGPKGISRSYSLANARFADKTLELHIRAVSGGELSEYWFKQAKMNDLLRINGPLGTFFLRETANQDIIFLATGTGIAPVKAMLESIKELHTDQQPKSVSVFWGGRTAQDLYFDVPSISGAFQYMPTLSRATGDWEGARGYVQNVLVEAKPDLHNSSVYACGSDVMIHSAKKLLINKGLQEQRFYSDAFVSSGSL
jgi:CDP-4-dehydro-6-deoxyglucose reductase